MNPIDAKTRAGRGVFGAIHSFPAVLGHDFSGVVVESPFARIRSSRATRCSAW